MILLNAKFEIIEQNPGVIGIYEQAELPGRICYGSQDRIAPGTAETFCKGLMKSNHGAPLEHNGVYLHTTDSYTASRYINNQFSKVITKTNNGFDTDYYITTNLRVLFENDWMLDIAFRCEPTEFHEKRITVSFTVDRFTGEEFLRHRKASFNRESTRYVNFSKEKFGGGDIKFIKPCWLEDVEPMSDGEWRNMCADIAEEQDYKFAALDYWLFALKAAEYSYNNLIRLGWEPQQARTVLPCAINSPMIMTAFVSDWCHFFNLRALGTTGKPHPQAKELAEPLMNEFIERGLAKIENGICVCQ